MNLSDHDIYNLWCEGKTTSQIARQLAIKETSAIHIINRVLNQEGQREREMSQINNQPLEALPLRFRPTRFRDVIGNEDEVDSLVSAIKKKEWHTYLLIGPSGVGKTTLARIAAKELGCVGAGLNEINASKYTGVDDMRAVEDMAIYQAFGSPVRCIIIDECHSLSAQAWQSLLKITEEPPKHVFWFFCTTNPAKIPDTIRTRCLVCNLQAVPERQIEELVETVSQKAKIKLPPGTAGLIAYEANGSPRQALAFLEKVDGAPDFATAERNLQRSRPDVEVVELCRYLCGRERLRWQKMAALLEKLQQKGENPEGIRILVVAYVAKCLRGAKTDEDACYFLNLLNNFSMSYNPAEQYAPLWLAAGRIVFNQGSGSDGGEGKARPAKSGS